MKFPKIYQLQMTNVNDKTSSSDKTKTNITMVTNDQTFQSSTCEVNLFKLSCKANENHYY